MLNTEQRKYLTAKNIPVTTIHDDLYTLKLPIATLFVEIDNTTLNFKRVIQTKFMGVKELSNALHQVAEVLERLEELK